LSAPDASLASLSGIESIPRDSDEPVFPTPWAARAFALAVAMNERGIFTWGEWSETLGPRVAIATRGRAGDAEAYWEAWLAALEDLLGRKQVAARGDLLDLKEAWREAAERTPHGQPIELSASRQA
jgi:nitrile hydratase accessory protein